MIELKNKVAPFRTRLKSLPREKLQQRGHTSHRRRIGSIIILVLMLASIAVGPVFVIEMLAYEVRSASVWAANLYEGKPSPGSCDIKGNINYRGQHIYHLPGQRYYTATVPERWFCSQFEAIGAGFRPARI
jgi:hypothetical protein